MKRVGVAIVVVACGLIGSTAEAQPDSGETKKLVVGTKLAPPFAFKRSDGTWTGISIELWQLIADDLKLEFEFKERTLKQLLDDTHAGKLDAAMAAITITAARERRVDFSHPFFNTGLGIAVSRKKKGGVWAFIKRVFSVGFVKVLFALLGVLLVVGIIVWWLERKRNPDQFGGTPAEGIGAGLWFSAVTMTTVGYGDKAPATLGGRLVALVWMFVSIIIISSFTAAITTTLTVSQLESKIKGPEDLPKVKVGTVRGSSSDQYLRREGIAPRYYPTVAAALKAVAKGEIGAAVYDAPILQYLVKTKMPDKVQVLPRTFAAQDYGIALPNGSPLREKINRVLLKRMASQGWRDIRRRYLGR